MLFTKTYVMLEQSWVVLKSLSGGSVYEFEGPQCQGFIMHEIPLLHIPNVIYCLNKMTFHQHIYCTLRFILSDFQ